MKEIKRVYLRSVTYYSNGIEQVCVVVQDADVEWADSKGMISCNDYRGSNSQGDKRTLNEIKGDALWAMVQKLDGIEVAEAGIVPRRGLADPIIFEVKREIENRRALRHENEAIRSANYTY